MKVAWSNGETVRLIEADENFDQVLAQIRTVQNLKDDLRAVRRYFIYALTALLLTWIGIAYALMTRA